MESIQVMREKRQAKVVEARKILDKDKDSPLAKPDQEKVDALFSEIEDLDAGVATLEKQMQFESGGNAEERAKRVSAENGRSVDENVSIADAESQIFSAWCKDGNNVAPEIQALIANVSARKRQNGSPVNVQETGDPAKGGNLVPERFADNLLEEMKDFGGVRKAGATIQKTDDGADIQWPTTSDVDEEGELLAENTDAADDEMLFGSVKIGAHKFSSKIITVPIELLQDSRINLEEYIPRALSIRLARGQNRYFTTGTGVGQPRGVVVASSEGVQAPALSYDGLVDLEHSLDPAYRAQKPKFMAHDDTVKAMKKLKDSQGRPLWVHSMRDGEPELIMGYEYVVNQNMAVPGVGNKTILFGPFNKYLIRDVMNVVLYRFNDSKYVAKGQIGFLAFLRGDGNWIDASDKSMKHFLQT